jgi:predicted dehydrogenase/threonine dehydrogenase-like Zn-dependent dehydrogenase
VKQVVRRVIDRKGRIVLLELPEPHLGPDQVLVQNHFSLISSGTELTTLGKTPLELVKQTISDPWMRNVVKQTVLSAGLAQTGRRVWQEMIMPREIGYSGAGRVLAVGEQVEGFLVGDPVAYAATGHAEVVAPHFNHIVPVPRGVDLRHAAFVTVGGIALQALRRAELGLGEVVAVYGLGLVGQLCVQLAKAAGCVVVGIDLDSRRNRLAADAGADLALDPSEGNLTRAVMDFTGKHGVDATVICAASRSEDIINSSMEITRKQGRVVLVGYVKLEIHPKNFLYKEIDLRYSRAYGPGSYHRGYEKGRLDYPFGYVRWTERRNLAEVIRLVASGALRLEPLIGDTIPLDRAQEAFDAIASGRLGSVAALLAYDERRPELGATVQVRPRDRTPGKVGISIIGCGNHVLATHLPNLRRMSGVEVRALASATGKNASMVAESVGATMVTTDVEELFRDEATDAVLVCSSQPEHAGHILGAVGAGKAVFAEKPMVTRLEDLGRVARLMEAKPVLFTLGLNRRYSPMVARMRKALGGPAEAVHYTIAQAYLPPEHWSLDEVDGGGRLISEGEHFIDLCHLLVGREPLSVYARALGPTPDDLRTLSSFDVTIHYDGAVAHVTFDESGSPGYPREKLTAFARGRVAVLDDFGVLTVHAGRKPVRHGAALQKQMGHREVLDEFVKAVKGEPNALLTWTDAFRATLTTFAAQESIRSGMPIDLRAFQDAVLEMEGAPSA